MEGPANQLRVRRSEPTPGAIAIGAEHAVLGVNGLELQCSSSEELPPEIGKRAPATGHLARVERRIHGLRGERGMHQPYPLAADAPAPAHPNHRVWVAITE
jgi:hypothetical protein